MDIKNRDIFGNTSSILYFCTTMILLVSIIILFVIGTFGTLIFWNFGLQLLCCSFLISTLHLGATFDCYSHILHGNKSSRSVPGGAINSKQSYEVSYILTMATNLNYYTAHFSLFKLRVSTELNTSQRIYHYYPSFLIQKNGAYWHSI